MESGDAEVPDRVLKFTVVKHFKKPKSGQVSYANILRFLVKPGYVVQCLQVILGYM